MEEQYKTAKRLEYFTLFYNLIEAAASIFFGLAANSISLVGFGLDSVMESLSGSVMIWRLGKHGAIDEEEEERIEKKASRLIGWTFIILAAYVAYESVEKIISKDISSPSLPGIVISAISLAVMPVLGMLKYWLGKKLGLGSLVADSKETFACSFLSAALLAGLAVRYFTDFWLSDPVIGLVITAFLAREGFELIRGDEDDR